MELSPGVQKVGSRAGGRTDRPTDPPTHPGAQCPARAWRRGCAVPGSRVGLCGGGTGAHLGAAGAGRAVKLFFNFFFVFFPVIPSPPVLPLPPPQPALCPPRSVRGPGALSPGLSGRGAFAPSAAAALCPRSCRSVWVCGPVENSLESSGAKLTQRLLLYWV